MNPIGTEQPGPAEDPEAELAAALEAVTRAFGHQQLQPDPGVGSDRPELRQAVQTFRERVLPNVRKVLSHVEAIERRRITEGIAGVAERLTGALLAANSRPTAEQLLTETLQAMPEGSYLTELAAASRDLEAYGLLCRARWLWSQGYGPKAAAAAEAAHAKAKEASLKAAAKKVMLEPQPLKAAPPLFTLNGFGVKLYGRADRRPDGFYAATLYIVALFIPLVPLSRYLVRDADGGGWHFRGKLPLSRLQRWYRRALVLGIAGLIAFNLGEDWWSSPARVAVRDLEATADKVKGLPADQALLEWDLFLSRWQSGGTSEPLQPAVEQWLALKLAKVHEPFTRADVDDLKRLAKRYEQLPAGARSKEANEKLAEKLASSAAQLGTSQREDLEARLEVMQLQSRLGGAAAGEARAESARIRRIIASQLAAEWPLRAVAVYVQNGPDDTEALEESARLLESLGEPTTLLAEESEAIEAWLSAAQQNKAFAARTKPVKALLDAAKALTAAPGRRELLESDDEKALTLERAKRPGDQSIAVALARVLRARGEAEGARKVLASLGPPGRQAGDAQLLSAFLQLEAGNLEQAEAQLKAYLDGHLARFTKARVALETLSASKQKALIGRAEAGKLPVSVEDKLKGQTREKQQEIFGDWLRSELDKDEQLNAMRDRYRSLSGVVEASLGLGTLELQRASKATGPARAELLDRAEKTFLAVSAEAEGSPTYHLGLGQVYHRLGKSKEGDEELMGLAKRSDARTRNEIVETYRGLGLIPQARELAKQVVDSGDAREADAAAMALSLMSTSEADAEQWLKRIKNPTPNQRASLAEQRGRRMLDDGRYAEADGQFQLALDIYLKDAKSNGSAANNAAVAEGYRFLATSDPRHLDNAVGWYLRATQLDHDSAIIVGNAAEALLDRLSVTLLERWAPARKLKLTSTEIQWALFAMFTGPKGDEVKKAVQTAPAFSQVLELAAQQQTLSPNDPAAYEVGVDLLVLLDDVARLGARLERLKAVEKLDLTRVTERLEKSRVGEYDEQIKTMAATRLKLLEAAAQGLSPGDAAASLYARSKWETRLGIVTLELEHFRRALALCRQAAAAPSNLALASSVALRAIDVGLFEVSAENETLAQTLKGNRWRYAFVTSVWSLAKRDEQVARALRKNATLRDAVAMIAQLPPRDLTAEMWAVADLLNETAARDKIAKQLPRDTTEAWLKLEERLEPGSPGVESTRELLTAMKGP